jgi:16S rRNA (adenine1518-N6/adenine1519-N6)-dimethyltransferase
VECLKVVRAACFWPRPEVDSAIVRLKRERALPEAPHERDVFLGLTKFAFSRRRKQMAVILRGMARDLDVVPARILEVLARLGVAGETRPEAVPVALWLEMAREFSAIPQGSGREPAARPDLGAVRERPRGLA